jgi:hypothetical protein
MNKEEKSIDPVEKLITLAKNQEELINLSNELLKGKNRMIELCEMEISMYKKENRRLRNSIIVSGVIFAVLAVLNLTRLLL